MRFEFPNILFLVPAAAVLLALFHLWAGRRKRRLLARFAEAALLRKLTRGVSVARQRWKASLASLAVLLILFCLARPQYGTEERPLRRKGIEVVIAIDCSQSMMAGDIKPTRFARAREQLRGLIQRLQGESVGIIAFAGVPIVQCPLTSDRDMAVNLLDSLSIDMVPVQGTAIGRAIEKARGMFRTAAPGNKVLVLLTDGEDQEKDKEMDPLKQAKQAADEGVRIYAIGIGSTEGAPIPLEGGGYKEAEGGKVNSRLDFDTLATMAVMTGGKAILANQTGQEELKAVTADLARLKEGEMQVKTLAVRVERFQYFLVPALLLLILEMLLGDRRRAAEKTAGRFD